MIISSEVGKIPKSDADTVFEITFTEDHRELWSVRGGAQLAAGRWRVEGDELVTTMETESFFGVLVLQDGRESVRSRRKKLFSAMAATKVAGRAYDETSFI